MTLHSSTYKSREYSIGQPVSDIYTRVTNKVLADLENGELTWRKPWNSENLTGSITVPKRWNAVPYSGINIVLLWATASEQGYTSPYWMTFKQAVDLKACVRKGEKGTQIVYADKLVKEEENDKGELEEKHIPYLKAYTVFNASQIDGLPENYYETPAGKNQEHAQRIASLETFFASTKAEIYSGTKAAYNQTADKIQMPSFASFNTPLDYYSTLAHELTHWTKHPARLNRDFGRKHFGDEGYAKEELVAELGACFLGAALDFKPMPEEHHAAYVQSWLKVLKDDKRFIFSAASHAQKAVEFLCKPQ
ncbi:zincin-like metallopeptidase domain-containing protein [Dyadobacter chenwenxiniae]|uniref:SsDNA-binding domain-containing protein n=1 Tax=Dyadobacter chenwenxiniae TaxID=2906456 RepID=A0A9X1PHI0_9BACT|nr:zincin-like metallopeptidase domain-containing protein [Dyadobacter chenwenxiniae]MCF0061337.1 ssDNA-binding domain-containing protein [Dyadobacter chenwenxiniae]UON81159.1 zincin-like metallopeptidase domain-containing protein [Dyadobacter chenwenxiniae]